MAIIKLRQGTAEDWVLINPILHSGEVGLEIDEISRLTVGKKIGNGLLRWAELPYSGGDIPEGVIVSADKTVTNIQSGMSYSDFKEAQESGTLKKGLYAITDYPGDAENPLVRKEQLKDTISKHNGDVSAHQDIRKLLENVKPEILEKFTSVDGQLYWDGRPVAKPQVFKKTHVFSNAWFEGELYCLEIRFDEDLSDVSIWGHATRVASSPAGQDMSVLSPDDYPLLTRFLGQVDQWWKGIDSGDWQTEYNMPVRITANEGVVLVTPLGGAIDTRFSGQFKLTLAEDVVENQ